ncbi:MAG TPA: hypothetical protein VK509_11360 [Polyangiales bacterium]|nr:hypothetical protein [Polyangiales bacterium]
MGQPQDEYDAEPYSGHDEDGVVNERPPAAPFGNPGMAMAKAETAVSAVAMQARTQVEARFLMAVHRPRDLDVVRVKLLKECTRPGFAETARYRRPIGKKQNERTKQWEEAFIEGPSIRFAEAAIRAMGNIDIQSPTIYDDDRTRIVRVVVTDLEANATYSLDITVEKTVERRKLRGKQKPLGIRENSYGDTVYIVFATGSEVTVKQSAEVSKAIRTLGLRLLPGDIQEECMAKCIATRDAKIKEDPEGARKGMIDGFASIGVSPDELKLYVQQDLSSLSPVQIGELRDLFLAIKDGVTTWGEVKRARAEEDQDDGDGDGDGKSAVDELRERTKKHAADVKAKKEAEKTAAATEQKPAETKAEPAKASEQPKAAEQPAKGEQAKIPGTK